MAIRSTDGLDACQAGRTGIGTEFGGSLVGATKHDDPLVLDIYDGLFTMEYLRWIFTMAVGIYDGHLRWVFTKVYLFGGCIFAMEGIQHGDKTTTVAVGQPDRVPTADGPYEEIACENGHEEQQEQQGG